MGLEALHQDDTSVSGDVKRRWIRVFIHNMSTFLLESAARIGKLFRTQRSMV